MESQGTNDLSPVRALAIRNLQHGASRATADGATVREGMRDLSPRRYGLARAGKWIAKRDHNKLTISPKMAWSTFSLDEAHERRFVLINAYGITTTIQRLP
jgi:hypothetical protein